MSLAIDAAGALYWPEERMLIVADLHFEKGSSYARRGQFLPPYDTAATLARLTQLVLRYAPRRLVALGDSFHDVGGGDRLERRRSRQRSSPCRRGATGCGSPAITIR